MQVVTTRAELRRARATLPESVGVVPTMGYLHAGHVALVARARRESRSAIVTVFVNPTQFGPNEDLARYPRDIEGDRRLCLDAGVDLLYVPAVEEVYRPGFATTVDVGPVARRWEGERRPGHFVGVATVVTKLLNMTRADRAYFGEKDFQQLQVVRRLVADLDLSTEIIGCPTVREPDGLALSSRNVYLTPAERPRASAIYRGLTAASAAAAGGERDTARLRAAIEAPLHAADFRIDYVAIVDPVTLEPLDPVDRPARALVAARLGAVRLIDNIALEPPR